MTSLTRKVLMAAGLAVSLAAATAHAAGGIGYSRDALRVLTQARAATGGSGWNLLRGWHETGHRGALPYESWLDPLRYGMRIETHEAGGVRVRGYNGLGEWEILPGGEVHGGDGLPTAAEARTAAFLNVYGFFYPGRFDAQGSYLGVRQAQGHAYDVVKVKPYGGKPRELWFDRRTHRLGRIVDRTGPKPISVQLSDYRRVGPVTVAMRHTIDGGDAAYGQGRQVESLSFQPADRNIFGLPRP